MPPIRWHLFYMKTNNFLLNNIHGLYEKGTKERKDHGKIFKTACDSKKKQGSRC